MNTTENPFTEFMHGSFVKRFFFKGKPPQPEEGDCWVNDEGELKIIHKGAETLIIEMDQSFMQLKETGGDDG